MTLTETAELRGGIRAARVAIMPGARILGSVIESPSNALGKLDIEAASRARPGTGPASQIEIKPFEDPLAPPPPPEPTIRIGTIEPKRLRVVR